MTYDEILARAEQIRHQRAESARRAAKDCDARVERVRRGDAGAVFTEAELRYSERSRCPCGAGLAYPVGIGMTGSWDCAAILTGTAAKRGEPGAMTHDAPLPFAFYEIRSESRDGTTRPSGVAPVECRPG